MLERSQKERSFPDPPDHGNPAIAGGRRRSPPSPPDSILPPSSAAASSGDGGNVDKVLFKNLVEMVPLVESLMDRRAKSSFTRRASMVYTPAPSQPKKNAELRGGKTAQSISAKKRRDRAENFQRDDTVDDISFFSSRVLPAENVQKEREELTMLREQVSELHKKLSEKDEELKSAENSIIQMNAVNATLDELRRQVAEKDSMIRSTNSQLYNAKIMLADKQAALEKLNWEARMSSRKVEELQGNVVSMDLEIAALTQLFEKLTKNDAAAYSDDSIAAAFDFEPLPPTDNIDEIQIEKMEEARAAYIAAVAAAKENPTDDLLTAAAEARLRLQAFVF
ncbi:protein MICROTUBULE BINDING PROTEIN 2C isoform X1 [Elaeis guineensis]|uniref:Protein MICROTUBULE BINDING PROTEIN 2C isoform X1 n=1 Tax=Elaeis guineensis var. tenera TaxID=51953 RepID=A0A6I9SI80_ELAGV|nr:protein MICROTUBULE BINDING PROTEIN 2C isoform X1 [Elaeis guineensis]